MQLAEYVKNQLEALQVQYPESLIDAEINALGLGYENYTQKGADAFFYSLIPMIMLRPASISEGGFSISYDRNSLLDYYKLVARRLGKEDLLTQNPTITDISDRF